jgi:hypothetical protein
MKTVFENLFRYPNVLLGVIRAGLAMAVGFGVGLTGEQVALVVVFSEAVFTAISTALSTPVNSPTVSAGTTVTVVNPGDMPNEKVTV